MRLLVLFGLQFWHFHAVALWFEWLQSRFQMLVVRLHTEPIAQVIRTGGHVVAVHAAIQTVS